ncbi:MAG: FG-GAP repeat protein [Bacteroidetes bacterium]|nr:FG-GAP repeat protein [Bacteroidota bacterium]
MKGFLVYISWRITVLFVWGFSIAFCVEAQITRLPYADTTSGNYFGTSVALDGKRAVVGASGERSCDAGSGAAYIYEVNDSTESWMQVARLVPQDCEKGLAFGKKVAIDGSVVLVAASREFFGDEHSNAVYVYEEIEPGKWIQTERLTGDTREQREGAAGADVAVYHDRALFTTSGNLSPGNEIDGAAYIYKKNAGKWILEQRLVGSGNIQRGVFGGNAALYQNFLAVASSSYFGRGAGSVYLFGLDQSGSWSEVARLGGIQDFFISLDLYENELIIGQARSGSRESGQATLFAQDSTGVWEKTATLEPPTPYRKGAFGTEVAIYEDRALVVGYDEQLHLNYNVDRVVYIYARDNDQWQYQGIIDIGEAAFGSSIDLHGNTALIGAASGVNAGKAYVVKIP